MNKLAIDTSTQTMGVSLMKENQIVIELTSESRNDHAKRLMPAVHQVMQQVNMTPVKLDSIVVTNGPGSYTGTRIGITTAKTLAWAIGIPLVTVSSLMLMAYNGAHFNGYICPFIDARRGRVYTGLYRWQHDKLILIKEETNIMFADWLADLADIDEPVLFLSSDMNAFKELIKEQVSKAVIPAPSVRRIHPSHLFSIAANEAFVPNVHEVVPNYLRLTEAEAKWLERQKSSAKKGD